MQTKITFPTPGLAADVMLDANKSVTIEPLFRMPDDTPTVAYIDSLVVANPEAAADRQFKVLHQYLLIQSGRNAKLRLIDCSKRTTPRYYVKDKVTTPAKVTANRRGAANAAADHSA